MGTFLSNLLRALAYSTGAGFGDSRISLSITIVTGPSFTRAMQLWCRVLEWFGWEKQNTVLVYDRRLYTLKQIQASQHQHDST